MKMMMTMIVAALMAFAAPTAAQTPSTKAATKQRKIKYVKQPLRIGISWDFQPELGIVVSKTPVTSRRFFSRVRAGVLFMHEPWILCTGITLEGSGLPDLAVGIQGEVTHLWNGLWAQAGLSTSGYDTLNSSLSVGFSLLGFEWQHSLQGENLMNNAYLIKVRIPIGLIMFAR